MTGDDHGSYLPCSHLSITPCFVHLMVSYGPIVQAFSSSRSPSELDWRWVMLASGAVLSESEWPGEAVTIITIMACTHHPAPLPLTSHWSVGENGDFSLVKPDKMVTIVSCAVLLCNLIIGFTFMFPAGNLQQIWSKFCKIKRNKKTYMHSFTDCQLGLRTNKRARIKSSFQFKLNFRALHLVIFYPPRPEI